MNLNRESDIAMDNAEPSPLLPEFLKKPLVLLWVNVLPQTILLILNLHAYSVISGDISECERFLAYKVVTCEIAILLIPLIILSMLNYRKRSYAWGWNGVVLISHIGYLWFAMVSIHRIIPSHIEPWIISTTNLFAYQFAFMMPGLFYAGLRLACFDVNIKRRAEFGLSLLATILAHCLPIASVY